MLKRIMVLPLDLRVIVKCMAISRMWTAAVEARRRPSQCGYELAAISGALRLVGRVVTSLESVLLDVKG